MRIGIVNDVPLAREALRRAVLSVPGYHVAWMAEDGAAAVRLVALDRPDCVLMDLVMPVMDGVEATRRIMAAAPCPILVVTGSVSSNFPLVLQAMSHGGVDAFNTPRLGPDGQVREAQPLLARLARLEREMGASAAPGLPARGEADRPPVKSGTPACPPLLALGASTGGPEALARVLEVLPADFPGPVGVIQHIDAEFAPNLIVWLRRRCRLPVEEAREGAALRPGVVFVAVSNDHLVLQSNLRCHYTPDPVDYPFRPSVNRFFESLAAHWPQPGVAVLLTGMGDDGARGLARLREAGWLTVAQDKDSSVVYGMPRAAVELHAACRVMPLSQIPGVILTRFHAARCR